MNPLNYMPLSLLMTALIGIILAYALILHLSKRKFHGHTLLILTPIWLIFAFTAAQTISVEYPVDRAYSYMGNGDVKFRCAASFATITVNPFYQGWVYPDAQGVPEKRVWVRPSVCSKVRSYLYSPDKTNPTLEQTAAMHVLTHEYVHTQGYTSESLTECHALELDVKLWSLLGVPSQTAEKMLETYKASVYPTLPEEYRMECEKLKK